MKTSENTELPEAVLSGERFRRVRQVGACPVLRGRCLSRTSRARAGRCLSRTSRSVPVPYFARIEVGACPELRVPNSGALGSRSASVLILVFWDESESDRELATTGGWDWLGGPPLLGGIWRFKRRFRRGTTWTEGGF
jgi:hypothetical protein